MALSRDVSGVWFANQGNGFRVRFNLTQSPFIIQQGEPPTATSPGVPQVVDPDRATLNGSASTSGLSSNKVKGQLSQGNIVLTVDWDQNDSLGEYSGTFNAFGRIVGVSVDLTHPQNVTSWSSEKLF